jgi:hypothetical protein
VRHLGVLEANLGVAAESQLPLFAGIAGLQASQAGAFGLDKQVEPFLVVKLVGL